MQNFLNVTWLIEQVGMWGIWAIVYAESGLFFGFFLPGDSLLFTAGLLASQNYFSIVWLYLGVLVFAVLGDWTGYYFGYKVGYPLFNKEDSLFFKKKYLDDAANFFEKHGTKAIVLARFIPIIRTFTPIFAGIGRMNYGKFITYNFVGGFLWSTLMVLGGYFLGRSIPRAEDYLWTIILAIVIISFLPAVWEFWKNRRQGV